mgnify:FL=1
MDNNWQEWKERIVGYTRKIKQADRGQKRTRLAILFLCGLLLLVVAVPVPKTGEVDKDTKIDGESGKGETYETDSMADYEKYLDDVMRRLEEEYGKQKWDLQIFFEEASGADPNRKEFNRLKAEIAAKKIDVVVTMRAATIARNWGQFMEFMLICSKKNVDVVCIDKVENAQAIFRRIQEFQKRFFEGSDVTCE